MRLPVCYRTESESYYNTEFVRKGQLKDCSAI